MAVDKTDGYISGLDEFWFNGKKVGYVSEDGISFAGDALSSVQIRAAQARNAVVKTIISNPGSDKCEFALIELKKENIQAVFGGTATGGVYSAPRGKYPIEGRAFIKCFSGHKIDIPKALLSGNLSGNISLAGVLQIKCTMEINLPDDGVSGPYKIYDPGEVVPDDPSIAEG